MKKSVRKLGYWIRTLQELREDMNDNDMLKFILKAWVHLLMYASIRGSREAHAKQLSEGGGLTTLVWIISEHEEERFVRLMCPALFLSRKCCFICLAKLYVFPVWWWSLFVSVYLSIWSYLCSSISLFLW